MITAQDAADIAAVVIWLGTNDASLQFNQLLHVPLPEYQENLIAIVNYLTVSTCKY